MRLVTIDSPNGATAGIWLDGEILEIAGALAATNGSSLPRELAAIFAGGDAALDQLGSLIDQISSSADLTQRLRTSGILTAKDKTKLLAPIPAPARILSCGANYKSHLAEMGGQFGAKPVAFLKNPGAVIGPDAAIVLPAGHDNKVDWEAEFCGVIGRACHDVNAEEALDYVVGYTMIIDVSARDWVKPFHSLAPADAIEAWDENLLGKQFATFCPMGPAITTKDELRDPAAARFTLKVNGDTKQSACTDDLVFSLAHLISYYSQWYTFEPGDIITTGSPAGVGFGMKPQQFLQDGDVVTLDAEGIGLMTNPVVRIEQCIAAKPSD